MQVLEHPIVFYMFGLPIRDTVVMTWIMMVIIILLVLLIKKRFSSLLETLLEFITSLVGDILNEDNLNPYLPVLGTLLIFILFSNILSLFPFLKSPTSDINTTVALSIVTFLVVHYYGIRKKGLWGYLKTISNPIFLLPLEIISQASRTLALTLRLFGNVMSGDLIVAIIFSIIPLFLPIPLVALSLLTGVLQAYIFTTLAALYISSAVEVHIDDEKVKKMKNKNKLSYRKEKLNEQS